MNDLISQYRFNRNLILVLLLGLFIFAKMPMMTIAILGLAVGMLLRTWLTASQRQVKVGLTLIYIVLLIVQLVFCSVVVFPLRGGSWTYYPAKLFAIVLLALSFLAERFIMANRHTEFYMPTAEDLSAISYTELRRDSHRLKRVMDSMVQMKTSVSVDHLKTVLADLPRHSATNYINHGTLTDSYFEAVDKTLSDLNLYLVVSNTGSPASEIISAFTQKQYNHVSIAFDRDLETIISYNGGDNVYPPGMNAENLEFFHQKSDASVLVYSLPVTQAQKEFVIDKVAEINREGSAYNLVGLVAKHSYRPNIMFCSQFVYTMLKLAGIAYFDKQPGEVRPTDFIELDYYKKLNFEYEITF